jgi:hypothetical protein
LGLKIVGYIFGALILAAGIGMYASTVVERRSDHLTPLRSQVSLIPGANSSFEVSVKATRDYEIVIDAETRRLTGDPVHPSITWRLSDGSNVVAAGNTTDQPSTDWWGTLEQSVGRFRGESGHLYTLALAPNSDTARIARAEPYIVVQVPRDNWEGQLAGNAIQVFAAFVVGALGFVVIAATYFGTKWLTRRKMSRGVA